MYKILTNTTYLYLIQYPEECNHVNYSKISRETNRDRKTVATEYQYLIDNNIDFHHNTLNITNFYNEVASATERAICIYLDLLPGTITREQVAKALGRGVTAIQKHWEAAYQHWQEIHENKIPQTVSGVYAILHNNQIIYIGSTSNIKRRLEQHRECIRNNNYKSTVTKYCIENNVTVDNLTFQPLLHTLEYKELEINMIHTIAPVCNTKSQLKQQE